MSPHRHPGPALVVLGLAGALAACGGPGASPAAPGPSASGDAARRVQVVAGDITDTVVLDAAVVSSPTFPLAAASTGRLSIQAPAGPSGADPVVVASVAAPDGSSKPVLLPPFSRVDVWIARSGDMVVAGMPVASATYSGFALRAAIPPEDLTAFTAPATSARGQIVKGPGPADCPVVGVVGLPVTAAGGLDPSAGAGPQVDLSSDPVVVCALPRDLFLLTGMRGLLAIDTATVHAVPLLPSDAVAGDSQRGLVNLVMPDGTVAQRVVELGVSDGDRIQILSGLAVGDTVTLPAPDLGPSASR